MDSEIIQALDTACSPRNHRSQNEFKTTERRNLYSGPFEISERNLESEIVF